ncbi:MAG: hypothetical protein KAJ18_00455 [Candidatus Omnitrophica bacterium]|nr:hypothetical protein [Candidatus Omnitrophota bacterium]
MFICERSASARTVIMFIVVVPVVAYLLHFAYKKNTESAERATRCQEECFADGYPGYDFKWDVLSGPRCSCLGESDSY